jgi:hypothetical protein
LLVSGSTLLIIATAEVRNEHSLTDAILGRVWPTLGRLARVVTKPEVARVCDTVCTWPLSIRRE